MPCFGCFFSFDGVSRLSVLYFFAYCKSELRSPHTLTRPPRARFFQPAHTHTHANVKMQHARSLCLLHLQLSLRPPTRTRKRTAQSIGPTHTHTRTQLTHSLSHTHACRAAFSDQLKPAATSLLLLLLLLLSLRTRIHTLPFVSSSSFLHLIHSSSSSSPSYRPAPFEAQQRIRLITSDRTLRRLALFIDFYHLHLRRWPTICISTSPLFIRFVSFFRLPIVHHSSSFHRISICLVSFGTLHLASSIFQQDLIAISVCSSYRAGHHSSAATSSAIV